MYTPRSHKARGITSSPPAPSISSTSRTSKTNTRTHQIGGNVGGNVGATAGPGFGDSGGNPTTTIPPPSLLRTTVLGLPTTIVENPPSAVTQNSGNSGTISNGNGGGGDGGAITVIGGSTFLGSSDFSARTTAPSSLAIIPPGGVSGTQSGNRKENGQTISDDPTSQTLSTGDISTTVQNSPSQTNSAVTQNANGLHRGLPSGGIAGIIIFAICLLVIVIFIVRRRKASEIELDEVPNPNPPDLVTGPPPREYEETQSALVSVHPHSPLDSTHTSMSTAQRSSSRLIDSDSDISYPGLSPPPMVEIDGRPRPVPTLVLDNSRYRRNKSRLSSVTSMSGDSHPLSNAQRQSLLDDASPIPPQPSQGFSLRTPPSPFYDSDSSRPSSLTSLQVPPSPRTPTRRSGYIPPIPPLPKSPPPIPGVHANPFVDKNPFDDPSG